MAEFDATQSLGSYPPAAIAKYERDIQRQYWEHDYLNLVEDILANGDDRIDRTGVGTRALFGQRLDIDLKVCFPAPTTKTLPWKPVTSELLWFLEGSSDERRLAEILHGTRDEAKSTIWTANAQADYWKHRAAFDGDLGRVYGVQWRHWKTFSHMASDEIDGKHYFEEGDDIDQVAELVKKLKNNPFDRRMIISAWNVGELNGMALPPCHMMAQFFVRNTDQGKKLSCQMYQRSVDVMLGLPFNIASYALLTHMLAQVAGMGVDRLIMNLGDTHIYTNHFDGAREQLNRVPSEPEDPEQGLPFLQMNPDVTDIDSFKMTDFVLMNYKPQPAIKMAMAV